MMPSLYDRHAFGTVILAMAILIALCNGMPLGGASQYEQQLHTASLLPFTEQAQSKFPVVEQWYFVEGITSSGVAFAYLNTVASYLPERSFSALRPVFGSSSGSICTYGKPLGRPFMGALTQKQNQSAVAYEGDEHSFFGVASDEDSFFVNISDQSANLTSSVAAFGPLFTFQYADVSLPGSPKAKYVQVVGKAEGQLHGESFSGWGGIEYHRGYQSWGTAPPFAAFWYRDWLVSANLTSTLPTYSFAILESNDSDFRGGYQGEGASATLLEDPDVSSLSSLDCDGVATPVSIVVQGLPEFEADTRIAVAPGFWWVGKIASGLFGWWETHVDSN